MDRIFTHHLLLMLFCLFPLPSSTLADKQIMASTLARNRINDALVVLAQVADDPAPLVGGCKNKFDPMQTSLIQSGQLLTQGKSNDAKEELNVVETLLDSCLESLSKSDSSANARTLLRRVSRSVSSAEELVAIAAPPKNSSSANPAMIHNTPQQTNNPKPTSQFAPSSTSPTSNTNLLPPSPSPLSFIVDYCSNHVTLQANAAIVRLDQSCGAKLHSSSKYASGIFTARIRTPVKANGTINSFYTSSSDQASDVISFDFLGNYPNRVLTSYAANGNSGGNQQLYVLSFDTSVDFHTYTIKWDSDSIVWLADTTVLRNLSRSDASNGYPTKAAFVYCYTWDASNVADGQYAGKVDWTRGPYRTYFTGMTVASPLAPGTWKAPVIASALSLIPIPMRPLAIDYCFSNVAVAASDISITFDGQGCGGRFRSIVTYPSGTFIGRVKCAAGDTSGLLSSFYLSSLEGSKTQDEIDFEWLGKDKNSVQTNYYVNGVGGHEVLVALGFDCSEAFHTYTIMYSADQIQWLVDGKIVRVVTSAKEAMFNRPYPVKPVYLYASVWNASSVNGGSWAGQWHGTNLPYTVYYSDVRIRSP